MAAEVMTLPEDRNVAGARIIEMTDSVGFDATGAGWAYIKVTKAWRFYLFTTMADTKGPLWIWERLAKAFNKMHLPDGITPLDIIVASPDETLYRSIFLKVGAGSPTHIMVDADVRSAGYGIDHIWLLRARPEASLMRSIARRDATARRFDKKVQQLLAA